MMDGFYLPKRTTESDRQDMNVWFELKAGKRTINEEGLVREEIEASQLCELTTMQDTKTKLSVNF